MLYERSTNIIDKQIWLWKYPHSENLASWCWHQIRIYMFATLLWNPIDGYKVKITCVDLALIVCLSFFQMCPQISLFESEELYKCTQSKLYALFSPFSPTSLYTPHHSDRWFIKNEYIIIFSYLIVWNEQDNIPKKWIFTLAFPPSLGQPN